MESDFLGRGEKFSTFEGWVNVKDSPLPRKESDEKQWRKFAHST
jgi:hypothetical protein